MQPQLDNDAKEFFSLIKRLQRAGVDASPPVMAQLSPALLALLEQVSEEPNCTIADLARALERAVPTVSIEVRRLQDLDLLGRRPHPSDRRSSQIFLTPAGKNLVETMRKARCQTLTRLLSGLSSVERRTLLTLLHKALQSVEKTANSAAEGS
ncbi:MarR family winged helix-turn-helix transcriptional regulator [Oceanithermus sp.]